MTPEGIANEIGRGEAPECRFAEEADGTVWLERISAQPVKLLDRALRSGESLGMDADGRVWLTGPDLRPIPLMRVGFDGPPSEVTMLLDPDDPRIDYLKEDGCDFFARPPELAPDPPSIEDWNDHPDRELLTLLGKIERPGSDGRPMTLIEARELPDPCWLVERLLVENELAVLAGKPKVGKTFAGIDLALCVATGEPFHGLAVRGPRPVVYIIGEGNPKLFAQRCEAWLSKHGIERPPATFRFIPARIAMNNHRAVKALVAQIGRPALVVIDTLTRNMQGDENSAAEMAAFVAGCDEIRERTGAAVLALHHESAHARNADGPMGHTRLVAAVDTSISLRERDGAIELKVQDQRNGPGDLWMRLRIAGRGDSAVLESAVLQIDEPDADFQDDQSGDDASRVRRIAATMDGEPRGRLEKRVAALLGLRSAPTARRRVDDALPIGQASAIEFEGMRLWLERRSGRSTVVRAVKARAEPETSPGENSKGEGN